MHLDFRVKPENDRKDTFGTAPKLFQTKVSTQLSVANYKFVVSVFSKIVKFNIHSIKAQMLC